MKTKKTTLLLLIAVVVALPWVSEAGPDLVLRGLKMPSVKDSKVYEEAGGGDFQVLFPVTPDLSVGPTIGFMKWNTEGWSRRFCMVGMEVVDKSVDSVPVGVAGRLDVSNVLPFGGANNVAWYLTGNIQHHIVTSQAELEVTVGGYHPWGVSQRIEASNTTTAGCGLDLAIDLNDEGTCAALLGGAYQWSLLPRIAVQHATSPRRVLWGSPVLCDIMIL